MSSSAFIGAMGTMLGSLGNFSANKQNQRLASQQRTWLEYMQNKQNDWNSAVNQRKRLEEAGLNPYLMMNGGNAGVAQSTPAPAVPTVNPFDYSSSMGSTGSLINERLGQLIQQKAVDADASKSEAEAEGIRIDNQTRSSMNFWTLQNLIERTDDVKLQKFYRGVQLNMLQQMEAGLVDEVYLRNDLTQSQIGLTVAQTAYQDLQSDLTSKELAVFDQRFLQELCVMASQINANNASARKSIEEAIEAHERKNGIKIDNKIKRDTAYAVVRSARWAATKMRYDAIGSSWKASSEQRSYKYGGQFDDFISNFYRKGINTLGSPLGTILRGVVK